MNKDYNYLKWKRKNVTLRGSNNFDYTSPNGGFAAFGSGLYTATLSNAQLAKKHGTLFFVVGAIPKHPKVVNSWNGAELFMQDLIVKYGKKHNIDNYFDAKKHFEKNTSIKDEMIANGYDGLIIKGREMVNYTPGDVKYFRTEEGLKDYYMLLNIKENKVNKQKILFKIRNIIKEEISDNAKSILLKLYNGIKNDYSIQRFSMSWEDVLELIEKKYEIKESDIDDRVQFTNNKVTDALKVATGRLKDVIKTFASELQINIDSLNDKYKNNKSRRGLG